MATEKLAMPVLNLNGSSAEDLIEQLSDACSAVGAAQDALAKASPHGRDYQLNPDDYKLAREQHEARQMALRAIADELETIATHVYEQQAERYVGRRR